MDITQFMFLMFAHYLGDYPLQSDFLATTKGKSLYSLFVHCFIYSMTIATTIMLIKGEFEISVFMVVFLSHIIIDSLKARTKNKEKALTTYLYIDQSLHLVINIIVFYFA